MKKFLWIFLGFFVIAAGVFGFSYWKLNSIAKYAIEEAGSKALKTKVTVDRVSLMPFSGKGTIYGFKVYNPKGFQSEKAIEVGKLEVKLNLSRLKDKVVEISKVEVFSPVVWYEGRGNRNNFTKLQANAMSESRKQNRKVAQQESKSDIEVSMKEFHFAKGSVHLVNYLPFGGPKTVDLPEIHLKNVDKMSKEELVAKLSQVVATSATKVGARMLASPKAPNLKDIKEKVLDKGAGALLKGLMF